MGEDLGKVFFCLYNDITWLNSRWKMFRALFTKSEGRIKLYNNTADLFFRILWQALFEDVVLQLSRITEDTATNGKENMTIRRLSGLVAPEIKHVVKGLTKEAVKKAELAKAWRDKALAHTDFNHKIDPDKNPIPTLTYKHIDEAMTAIIDVMNAIYMHYCQEKSLFCVVNAEESVEGLIAYLHKGWQSELALQERMNSGTWRPEDLNFTDDV